MLRKSIPVVVILIFLLSACDLHIRLPLTIKTGPLVTDEINVPLPADTGGTYDLMLSFGAGTLKLNPGSSALVSGTAEYNISDFKPEVTITDTSVRIEQGDWQLNGIPDVSKVKNEWDLALGSIPFALSIDGGAYNAEYELGGLALTSLNIDDGASDVRLNFATPNNVEMSLLSYSTGASNVTLAGLGNANFTSLQFESGAGNYTLDFSGELQRDGSVHIGTGVSNMTLVIPAGVPAQVTVDGGLSNVSHPPSWEQDNNVYTQNGNGPQLIIVVEIGAGNLTLTQ